MQTDKIEYCFGKNSDTPIDIQIELSHNWKWSGDIFWQNWRFHITFLIKLGKFIGKT